MYKVYMGLNLVTWKPYIGFTGRSFNKRLNEHLNDCNKPSNYNNKFYNALRKYGKSTFKWIILFETDNKNEALNKELEYMDLFNSIKDGYNSAHKQPLNGLKNKKLTLEHKKKIGAANKRKIRTPEFKKWLSEHFTGRYIGENNTSSKLWKLTNINDNTEIIVKSLSNWCKNNGFNGDTFWMASKTKSITHGCWKVEKI